MTNFPDAHKVYDLAAVFRERVIEQGRSFLWPDQEIWTVENAADAIGFFNQKEEAGEISKNNIGIVAATHSPVTAMIAADAISARAMFGVLKNSIQFQKRLDQFYIGENMAPPDRDTLGRLLEVVTISLPHSHTMWGGHAIPSMIGYINTFRALRMAGGFSGNDFSRIEEIFAAAYDPDHPSTGWWAWDFLHIAYPDDLIFATTKDRDLILRAFGNRDVYDVSASQTEALKQIRSHLAPNIDPRDFSFYEPEIMALWERDQKRVNNFRTWQGLPPLELSEDSHGTISPKFALTAQFRERVIENNGSFLWPDDEEVWKPENAHAALDLVKHLAGKTYESGMNEMIQIASSAPRPIYQILCDTRAAIILNRKSGKQVSETEINRLLESQGPFDGERTILQAVTESADSEYPGVILSNHKLLNQYIVVLHGITSIISFPETIGDRDAMVQQFWDTNPLEHDGIAWFSFPFWSFFYLLYPEQVASLPGAMDREHLLKAFAHLTEGKNYPNDQAQMADIRKQLEPDFDPYTFDFYAEPWRSKWLPNWRKIKGRELEENEQAESSVVEPNEDLEWITPAITDLAAATYLDVPFLEEIEGLLKDKKQLIFEGPPGSGKTFVADKFARYFTGQPLNSEQSSEQIELVQFHQSYSYEDFVEGIRPRTNDAGQLVYDVEPGIFREFAERAQANPHKPFVLIIDEINRGNVSRILGELMLLLEYRDKSARLPYSKKMLQIPKNLYIIGTMNSADRSLSQIDYALRRRFYFVRFMSVADGRADVLDRWLDLQSMPAPAVLPLFIRLNALLEEHVGTDDLQVGHSYFMREDIHETAVQEQVWKYAVMPLLREYLYHHRERDLVLARFELLQLGDRSPATEDLAEMDHLEPDDV